MSRNNEIGKQGELIAAEFLRNKGYEIIQTNWRYSRAELDIICKHNDHLIFVEVKTRSYNYYGEPAEFVTTRKEEFMMAAAAAFMEEIKYEWKFRFDVISILLHKDKLEKIEHFEDAFWPGW